MSRRLQILSASFTKVASLLLCDARSIWSRLRSGEKSVRIEPTTRQWFLSSFMLHRCPASTNRCQTGPQSCIATENPESGFSKPSSFMRTT